MDRSDILRHHLPFPAEDPNSDSAACQQLLPSEQGTHVSALTRTQAKVRRMVVVGAPVVGWRGKCAEDAEVGRRRSCAMMLCVSDAAAMPAGLGDAFGAMSASILRMSASILFRSAMVTCG